MREFIEVFLPRAGIGLAVGIWSMLTLGLLVAWQTAAMNRFPSGWSREKAILCGHYIWLYGVAGLAAGVALALAAGLLGYSLRPGVIAAVLVSGPVAGACAFAVLRRIREAFVSTSVFTFYPLSLLVVAGPVIFVISALDPSAVRAVPGGPVALVIALILLAIGTLAFVRSYQRGPSHPEKVRKDLDALMTISASPESEPEGELLAGPACHSDNPAKVLLVGWDGATWKIIRPMMERGELPNLKRLMELGSAGTMQTYTPPLSPVIWSSIATGCLPSKHGVRDFTTWRFPGVTTPVSELPWAVFALKLLRMLAPRWETPVSSDALKCPTLWQVLGNLDKNVGVIGWWGSWPAQEVNGFVISDRVVFHPSNMSVRDLSSLEGLTHPEALYGDIREMLRDPDSVTLEEARQFMNVDKVKPGFRTPHDPEHLFKIALTMSESFRELGLKLYKETKPDLFAIYFQGIDFVSHYMWQYAFPEEFESVPPEDVRAYGEVITRFYAYQDEILGEFLDAADEDTCTILLSDHGFDTDHHPFMPTHTGRHDLEGIYIMGGRGVRRGIDLTVTPADVTPTILALMGATVSREMDGRVLSEALDPQWLGRFPVRYVKRYPDEYMSSRDWKRTGTDKEIIERLKALGYLE